MCGAPPRSDALVCFFSDPPVLEAVRFDPTAKPALLLCVALDKRFEDLFSF